MGRAVLCDCLPWLALALASGICLWFLVRLNEGGLRFRRLRFLHRNQAGSAQSLSFVLTLPFFVVVLLFIVQVSQLMIGTIMVHYAAFAAARAAVVWIPAGLGSRDNWTVGENWVGGSGYGPDFSAPDQAPPSYVQPGSGGLTYILGGGGPKYDKIASTARLACLPICPSRSVGLAPPATQEALATQQTLRSMYQTLAPGTSLAEGRVRNKMAYAMRYTAVEVRFYHDNSEPPLGSLSGGPWGRDYNDSRPAPGTDTGPGSEEFWPGQEIGWQDPITVTVTHYLALLPGPGRILANKVGFIQTPVGGVQQRIEQDTQEAQAGNFYVYKLTASCTLGNEGAKSVLPYEHPLY